MTSGELNKLKNPSALMRPAPFWSWNDKLDETELRRQIREMAAKGWGSYFIHSRVGLVTEYLSDEWMSLVNACVDEAQKTGTYAWIYDEDKWPSGFAGGEVPEKSESYRSRALVLLKAGSETEDDTILCDYTYAGISYSICKRVSPLGNKWFNGASYVDLMSPDAVREFIDCTHERYKKSCGQHFGKTIPGVFTDEPCYLMFNHYNVPVAPWSDFLPEFFRKTKGYDITEHLAQIFFDIEDYRKVRFDFYDAATALFKQSFTKQYYDWCDANGLIMTGHYIIEDSLRDQTQWSGDVMSHYEFMHWPGIDKLCRHIEQIVTCKQVSSVVDQLGKDRAFCETYGAMGGQCGFFHRKWIGDWQAALGISFINHHLSLYSMRGERKRDYPANLFYQQPWWEDERGFADYQGRLCAAVSEGERLVDILVLQPLMSVWSEYSPLHKDSGYALESAYDRPFDEISRSLMAHKLDYHYGNENIITGHGSVEDKHFKIGQHSYSCVIIPPTLNVKSTTAALLREHVKNGGLLICIGAMPTHVDGVESELGIQGVRLATSVSDAVAIVAEAFPQRIKVTDKFTGQNAPSAYVHSRMVDGSIRHLIVNTDEKREVRATVEIPDCAEKNTAAFDLYDGSLYRLDVDNGCFDVTLAPAGSLLVICGEEAKEAKDDAPAVLGSGATFRSVAKEMPTAFIDSFDCEVLEENVLVLNDFMLEMGGKTVYEGSVCNAWHKHFYPAPDGTPFKATYTFHSECELDGCFAVLEMAENLDAITFNGEPVTPLKRVGELGELNTASSWKDINFTKIPLPHIQRGSNTLAIEGRKVNNITGPNQHCRTKDWRNHHATEAEEVYICGRFLVKQVADGLYTMAPFQQPTGKNLTHEGFPFYCGRVALRAKFDFAKRPGGRVLLKLIGTNAACARVKLNGSECGTLRWEPLTIDISHAVKQGDNNIEVELATTLVNAFGPNRNAGIKEEIGIGPMHFCDMSRFKDSCELFDFGINGVSIYLISD